MDGKLFVVSTPIGNLKDITLRALEVLQLVDFILCEDTRITSKLLNHYKISKKLVSFNAVSETNKIPAVLKRLKSGNNCALVSDSGTPVISDPGVRLISHAIKDPSALTAALTVAGLPTDSFVYEGFLPQKKGRQKKLQELSKKERTIVLYESTYRIVKLIDELTEYMPERYIVVCRELTKKFEESWRGYPEGLKASLEKKTIKGEFVVVIAPKEWRNS
jgi:16S rRNA (cytidine1402-2'-O)-methyltransferase